MTEYTSIRVTKAAKEAAQESKAESETWNEFLQRCTENPPEIKRFVEESATNTVQLEATEYSKIAEEVTHKLEGLQR